MPVCLHSTGEGTLTIGSLNIGVSINPLLTVAGASLDSASLRFEILSSSSSILTASCEMILSRSSM